VVTRFDRYEILHEIGNGAAGVVHLVKKKTTGEKFALKIMNTKKLSAKDKKSAECEVEFLRVITGPTIIKFYESWVEKENIYIVMEFAEGGCLSELIRKHQLECKPFDED
jgi:serine/threonine protein kinase